MIRQNIIDKIILNLKDISIANGYSLDIDDHVWEWRDTVLSENEVPGIIIRDTSDIIADQDEQEHQLSFEIVALASEGNNSTKKIRNLMQDILTAFGLIEKESYVCGANYLNSEMEVEHLKKRYAAALMTFTVSYYEDLWKI
jgi:hypothetical protein